MAEKNLQVFADVEVTVRVRVGTWGADWNVEELHKSAVRDAQNVVLHMISSRPTKDVVMVGETKVRAVITERS